MRMLAEWQARLEELQLTRRRLENEANAYLAQVNGRLAMIDANIADVNAALDSLQGDTDGRETPDNGRAKKRATATTDNG